MSCFMARLREYLPSVRRLYIRQCFAFFAVLCVFARNIICSCQSLMLRFAQSRKGPQRRKARKRGIDAFEA